MNNHTPTPWEARNVSGAGWEVRGVLPEGFKFDGTCHGADGQTSFQIWVLTTAQTVHIASERWVQFETAEWERMQRANAEFIVRACNCHDELLAACEGIADDDVRQAYEVLDFGPGGTTDEFKAQQLIDERMAAVRAAIAKAKGGAA